MTRVTPDASVQQYDLNNFHALDFLTLFQIEPMKLNSAIQKECLLCRQPPPQATPMAFFITGRHGVDQVPLAMEADLNAGTVSSQAPYRLEYLERFTDEIGKNIVFYSKSDKASDKAGYISTFSLVIE